MFGLLKSKEEVEAKLKQEEIVQKAIADSKELRKKEFDGIRSICLDCKHAFYQKFIPNPETPDPLDLLCKKKLEIPGLTKRLGWSDIWECANDQWNRKVLDCSDFEKK